MGSTNPSFFGFGDTSKAGIIYNTEGFDQRISDKESGDKKDLTKENDIYFTYALFAVLAGTVCYILFKPLKN